MISPRSKRLGEVAAVLGLAVFLAAGLWWWLVFRQLIINAYISVPRALPCMIDQSVVCRLAQALCTSDHILGIRRYYAEISWLGAGLLAVGMLLRLVPGRAANDALAAGGK